MVPLFQIIIIRRKFFSFNFWERFSLPSEFRATFLKKSRIDYRSIEFLFSTGTRSRSRPGICSIMIMAGSLDIYTIKRSTARQNRGGFRRDRKYRGEVYYDSTWAVPGNPLCNGPVIDLNSGDNGSRRGSAYFAEPILLESKDRRAFDPSFSFHPSVLVWNEKRWYTFLYNAIRLIN